MSKTWSDYRRKEQELRKEQPLSLRVAQGVKRTLIVGTAIASLAFGAYKSELDYRARQVVSDEGFTATIEVIRSGNRLYEQLKNDTKINHSIQEIKRHLGLRALVDSEFRRNLREFYSDVQCLQKKSPEFRKRLTDFYVAAYPLITSEKPDRPPQYAP